MHNSSGWWYTYPSEKYEFVNWDDDSSQLNGKSLKKSMVPKHPPDIIVDLPIKSGDFPYTNQPTSHAKIYPKKTSSKLALRSPNVRHEPARTITKHDQLSSFSTIKHHVPPLPW